MRPESGLAVLPVTLLLLALAVTTFGFNGLKRSAQTLPQDRNQEAEVMYLPSGTGLKLLSLGYRNALADLLWFNTVNYFGKHFKGDKDYRWFSHMCDLVTTLDPKIPKVYEFCATMLAWELKAPGEANRLLTRGIAATPDYWIYPYLRGFNYLYFFQDGERAVQDFVAASKLPDAHPVVARIAAKKMSALQDPTSAINFLADLVRTTEDPMAKKALTDKLKELVNKLKHDRGVKNN